MGSLSDFVGGSALPQAVQAVKTDAATTTSTSWADTGLSLSITLSDASNKVLVRAALFAEGDNTTLASAFRLVRGASTVLVQGDASSVRTRAHFGSSESQVSTVGEFLDSPGTVGPHTYKVQWIANAGTLHLNRTKNDGFDNANRTRGASTLTALEVS